LQAKILHLGLEQLLGIGVKMEEIRERETQTGGNYRRGAAVERAFAAGRASIFLAPGHPTRRSIHARVPSPSGNDQ
jgi:hypothetical protein